MDRPRDLIWRQAFVEVDEGPEGEVYLPMVYAPLGADADIHVALSTPATSPSSHTVGRHHGRTLLPPPPHL